MAAQEDIVEGHALETKRMRIESGPWPGKIGLREFLGETRGIAGIVPRAALLPSKQPPLGLRRLP